MPRPESTFKQDCKDLRNIKSTMYPLLSPNCSNVFARVGQFSWMEQHSIHLPYSVQHAERCGATRMYLLASDDWDNGIVRVKELLARTEREVHVAELLSVS